MNNESKTERSKNSGNQMKLQIFSTWTLGQWIIHYMIGGGSSIFWNVRINEKAFPQHRIPNNKNPVKHVKANSSTGRVKIEQYNRISSA